MDMVDDVPIQTLGLLLSEKEAAVHIARVTHGKHLMGAVGQVVPVLPVPLMATVFVRNSGRSLSVLELKSDIERILDDLDAAGAHVYVPRKDLDYALDVGLRMLRMRHLVDEYEGLFSARLEELPMLRYYANSIAHLLPA